ncbi:helix-turn-helix domain-containing protein [Kocuria flava]|uniref:helix-turn-helix domain-containing protein n=1 Tax=Kocuria flava TaxID=446860 RepID=UPI002F938068
MTTVVRSSFATQDPDEAVEALSQIYGDVQIRSTPGQDFTVSASWTTLGPLSTRRIRWDGALAPVRVDNPGWIKIGQLHDGRLLLGTGRAEVRADRQPFLFPRQFFEGLWDTFDVTSVVLEAAPVQDYARELLDDNRFQLNFTGSTPLTRAAAAYWADTMADLQHQVLANEEAMSFPLIRTQVFRSTVAALLHCFPSTFLDHTSDSRTRPELPAAVRRAVSFIEEHRQESIGVIAIAAAARVSPHSLVAAFRRHLGTTPTDYLRTTRLDGAHADLLEADPTTGTTVRSVAHRWGFPDLRRFTVDYRLQHGEDPSSTLHR